MLQQVGRLGLMVMPMVWHGSHLGHVVGLVAGTVAVVGVGVGAAALRFLLARLRYQRS